jgi:hypothetical protein
MTRGQICLKWFKRAEFRDTVTSGMLPYIASRLNKITHQVPAFPLSLRAAERIENGPRQNRQTLATCEALFHQFFFVELRAREPVGGVGVICLESR